jgi:hypothetical protein
MAESSVHVSEDAETKTDDAGMAGAHDAIVKKDRFEGKICNE